MRVPWLSRTPCLWSAALIAGAAGAVALGSAAARPSSSQDVFVRGAFTYVWHGDRSRGCAAEGLCGVHGSLIVDFTGFGNMASIGRNGSAALNGASATVRVRRDDPGAHPGECVDLVPIESLQIRIARARPGRYTATLGDLSASSGRCAGPIAGELRKSRLAASRLRTRELGFDLRGKTSFAAGPFSGELISTVVLAPDTIDQSSGTSVSTTSGGAGPSGAGKAPPPPRRVLVEHADIRYRIAGASGALAFAFSGAADPFCEAFDDCGVSGSLALTLPSYENVVELSGSRTVSRRVGQRRALADLRAGRLALGSDQPALHSMPRAVVSETMTRTGDAGCAGTVRQPIALGIGGFLFEAPAGALRAVLGTEEGQLSDPLRTHCPGPATADVTGASNLAAGGLGLSGLAFGSLAVKDLGSRQLMISLRSRGSFVSPGYSGTRAGSLTFTLRLIRATGGTRRERLPGGP